jgi:hypothetical protein
MPNRGLVLIFAKDVNHERALIEFLKRIGAANHPALILDDEADQATPEYDDSRQNRDLVRMVTINRATIANTPEKVGQIRPGDFAVLVVVRGDRSRPYGTLVDARPQDVELVLIGGQPYYGSPALLQALGQASDSEDIDACGVRKLVHLTYHNQADNPLNVTMRELTAKLSAAMA